MGKNSGDLLAVSLRLNEKKISDRPQSGVIPMVALKGILEHQSSGRLPDEDKALLMDGIGNPLENPGGSCKIPDKLRFAGKDGLVDVNYSFYLGFRTACN